jgi:hypothetical protein
MITRSAIVALICAALVCSCGGGKKKTAADTAQDSLSTEAIPIAPAKLDSLTVGEFFMKDDAFGETIPLAGTSVEVDDIFKVSGTEAVCVDTLLIMFNRQRADKRFLSVYSLPSLTFIESVGTFGRGPGEFIAPSMVPVSDDPGAVCYVVDMFTGQFSVLTPGLDLVSVENPLPEKYREYTSEKMYTARNRDEMIFSHGNSIVRWRRGDTLATDGATRLCDLSLRRTNPGAAYTGALGVNYEQQRFVYAYKFVKRIVFGDFDGGVRALQFGKVEKNLEDDARSSAGGAAPIDSNTTHYWKIYTTPEHVYVSYSGRTPVDVHKANQKGERHIFMEVFDWNGNPLKRYRLDEWGYFTVDEERDTLWLLSADNPISFRAYELQSKN